MSINGGSRRKPSKPMPGLGITKARPFNTPMRFDPQTGTYHPINADANTVPLNVLVVTVAVEQDDYLECKTRPGSLGRSILVAKPYILRKTPFDGVTVSGVTYNYLATDGGNSRVASADGEDDETQMLTPFYYVGEQLTVISNDTGIRTVAGTIKWSDLNTAGRCWAVYASQE